VKISNFYKNKNLSRFACPKTPGFGSAKFSASDSSISKGSRIIYQNAQNEVLNVILILVSPKYSPNEKR
jgi:hypothetical protein